MVSNYIHPWPELPYTAWEQTSQTLQRWLQMAGKIRLQLTPPINHWWHVPLYITSRGMSTSLIPYGNKMFEIIFDFTDHHVLVETSEGEEKGMQLLPYTVSEFYSEFMDILQYLDINVKIWPVPVETEDTTPFYADRYHKSYNEHYVENFWHILIQTEKVMQQFRSLFLGKCSPIHFFWGGFDLAVTRFSTRKAPKHPSMPNLADFVSQEAYSHEVCSCGFWSGGDSLREPVYYSYAYPEPPDYKNMPIFPKSAFYSQEFHEFILPYDSVRTSINPEKELLTFFQSTYEAAAETAHWDRHNLEREPIPKTYP